jgi:hypothetical protein
MFTIRQNRTSEHKIQIISNLPGADGGGGMREGVGGGSESIVQ